jgi:hypothetical protein
MAKKRAGRPATNDSYAGAVFELEFIVAVFSVWKELAEKIALRPPGTKKSGE